MSLTLDAEELGAVTTVTFSASNRARVSRLRVAMLLAVLLIPAAAATAGEEEATVYIWRDASGVVRFSAPR